MRWWSKSTKLAGGRNNYGYEGFRGIGGGESATRGNRAPLKATQFTARFRQNPQCATRFDLASVARELNSRPRQTLGWLTPCEVFRRSVASTA